MSTAAPPRRRRTLQVAIGIILVVFAFVGVLLFSRLSGSSAPTAQQVTIIGAARDIKTGLPVTSDDLATITVETMPTGAQRDRTVLVGKVARHDITKGTAVLDADVAAPAIASAAKLYFALPAGKVALNIPASDISPYVQPGDQIDIIASPKAGGSNQYKVTLKGLRVLSVGAPQAAAGAATAPNGGGNLIVEVTLQDAEAVEFLVKNTDFTYVLRSPLDQANPDPSTSGVDLPTFKQIYGFR